MFHRILVEDWMRTMAVASFSIFFIVFVLNLIRVFLLPNAEVKRLENLPLADDTHES